MPSHSAHPSNSPPAASTAFFPFHCSLLPLLPHCCNFCTKPTLVTLNSGYDHFNCRSTLHCITTRPICDQEERAPVLRFSAVTIFMATNAPAFFCTIQLCSCVPLKKRRFYYVNERRMMRLPGVGAQPRQFGQVNTHDEHCLMCTDRRMQAQLWPSERSRRASTQPYHHCSMCARPWGSQIERKL